MDNVYLRGGTIVTAEGTFFGDIEIRHGRIAAVIERDPGLAAAASDTPRAPRPSRPPSPTAEAESPRPSEGLSEGPSEIPSGPPSDIPVLDVTGMHVFPGLIDVHVHFRDPGATHKEDFITGTKAAAAGGVTTVLDMPNTVPPVATAALLKEKAAVVQDRAYVDYGLYAVVNEDNLYELPALAEAGAAAFKLFLGPTTGDIRAPGWGRLLHVFESIRHLGLPLVVHAEDRDVIEYWEARVQKGSEAAPAPAAAEGAPRGDAYETLLATRPRFGEVAATQTVCLLAAMTETPVHIAHVTLAEAAEVIRQAKAAGAPVTAETCPTYLTMDAKDCRRLGTMSKILPPIRRASDREALWRALHDGAVDLIATDHAPHEADAKGDCWVAAAGGMIGVETMLPLLLTEAQRGRLSLSDLVRWTSLKPASAFGLAGRKGDIRAGLDGDLVVVDLDRQTTVRAEHLQSRSKNSPLLGRQLQGSVVQTIVRGRIVFDRGRFIDNPPGRPIRQRHG